MFSLESIRGVRIVVVNRFWRLELSHEMLLSRKWRLHNLEIKAVDSKKLFVFSNIEKTKHIVLILELRLRNFRVDFKTRLLTFFTLKSKLSKIKFRTIAKI